MAFWNSVKLGDFLTPYRFEHAIQNDRNYRQVTISKSGTVSLRGVKQGSKIGRKRQFEIDLERYPNTILFTRQGILDGAIGVAPPDIDKCVVTENMPMMSVDTSIIEMEYLRKFLLSDQFFEKVRKLKVVGSAQKSIHERDLLAIEIYLPDKDSQLEMCKRFRILDSEQMQLSQELTHQQTLLKKLRQQILQEAIEGKLTADWRAKNPDVEPASELLKRIAAEKAQLVKDRKIRAQKPLPPITDAEKPFELPQGWVWCRLADIANVGTGATPLTSDTSYYGGHINWMTSADTGQRYVTSTKAKITQKAVLETNCKVYPVGTLVIAMYGQGKTRGQITELKIEAATNQACAAISIYRFVDWFNQFVKIHFWKMYDEIRELARGGAQPNLNMDKIKSSIIALPPLDEQKAIVTKVEKLLALCDQLETQITKNQAHAEQLIQAVLKEAFGHNREAALRSV